MEFMREIGIYQKDGAKLIGSVPIDIAKTKLIEIFSIDTEEDPNALKVYNISEEQYLQLSVLVPALLSYKFDNVEMFCESFQA